ncbi:hypothetical protein EN871_24035 [bacterium M00.F.Ca.ET.228.01.1.1]|uniref:type III secretion system protein SctP n=1 Tax=Paraburkholderia phenoliruptrix TaxID=252970 RepID=UPI001092DDF0|nr:type III secretion system protein SctP [Paraburkholderia phenoliruptrix]TGP41524.1 hypothetical protein EN871_24035 [bacterium M00.F.Ca.ET.228.01.1.1]TGR98182.1 hypothetical protein EN834_23650 [bacterium M00.F.Ca.ET.191.01.1.1]TGU02373.1 hypothetical protein EN798_24470 [bacterium M00.F.Ca.ET.155.01.1.1]MBW0447176.1 type III secretion system protein SctP [Paraburkholderia phenoliruptrix]MBW9101441.1 type III secretion system protein SctP [Paraburkholderia phenoliruptrix]
MTRICSAREIRITPAVPARNGPVSERADSCSVAADKGADVQRFGALYDAARQRTGNGAEDHASDDDSPQGGAHDQADEARDDGTGSHAPFAREPAQADAPPTMPLPSVPPLPPLHPLSNALLALRKHGRTSAADSSGIQRKSANASPGRSVLSEPPGSSAKTADELLGIQMIRRCAQAAEGDLLAQHLAEHVAGFCTSPAVRRTGQWEIAVELDPSILPRTQLHLCLSGSALSLRFDSRDPRGRQLICDNSNELKSRLEARLGGQIAVEVTVL